MKREIKFRGKCLNDGTWVYGDLLQYDGGSACEIVDQMINFQQRWVDPASVGQFTGLVDSKKREIYEGDVVSTDRYKISAVIGFIEGCFCTINPNCCDSCKNGDGCIETLDEAIHLSGHPLEVIGSIHDQPELINH